MNEATNEPELKWSTDLASQFPGSPTEFAREIFVSRFQSGIEKVTERVVTRTVEFAREIKELTGGIELGVSYQPAMFIDTQTVNEGFRAAGITITSGDIPYKYGPSEFIKEATQGRFPRDPKDLVTKFAFMAMCAPTEAMWERMTADAISSSDVVNEQVLVRFDSEYLVNQRRSDVLNIAHRLGKNVRFAVEISSDIHTVNDYMDHVINLGSELRAQGSSVCISFDGAHVAESKARELRQEITEITPEQITQIFRDTILRAGPKLVGMIELDQLSAEGYKHSPIQVSGGRINYPQIMSIWGDELRVQNDNDTVHAVIEHDPRSRDQIQRDMQSLANYIFACNSAFKNSSN